MFLFSGWLYFTFFLACLRDKFNYFGLRVFAGLALLYILLARIWNAHRQALARLQLTRQPRDEKRQGEPTIIYINMCTHHYLNLGLTPRYTYLYLYLYIYIYIFIHIKLWRDSN